jgi:hypothetical protein
MAITHSPGKGHCYCAFTRSYWSLQNYHTFPAAKYPVYFPNHFFLGTSGGLQRKKLKLKRI